MTVAMGMSHVITLEGAVGMILGANIDSCITGLIASLRLSRSARRASAAQISINVFGVLLFVPFITRYAQLVCCTSDELPRQIANAHTIFNVVVSCILFPWVKWIARFCEVLVPERESAERPRVTAFIDEMQRGVPAVALREAARELARLGGITATMLEGGCRALVEKNASLAEEVVARETEMVDPISALAMEEMALLAEHAHGTYLLALRSFAGNERELAQKVCWLESEFDSLYWKARQGHIARVAEGLCHPEADVIFTETLRSLERVSDHAENVGVSVLRT